MPQLYAKCRGLIVSARGKPAFKYNRDYILERCIDVDPGQADYKENVTLAVWDWGG